MLKFTHSARAILAAVLLTISGTVHAQEPSSDTLAAAKELVEVTGVLKQFETMLPAILGQINQGLTATDPAYLTDNRQKEALDAASKIAFGEGEKLKAQLTQDIIKLYAQRFSASELKDISSFMKSKAGTKFVTEAPSILQDSMRLGQYWNAEISSKLSGIMREELGKRGVK